MFLEFLFLIANHHQCHHLLHFIWFFSFYLYLRKRQTETERICLPITRLQCYQKRFFWTFLIRNLNKNDTRESYILMLSHQGVGLFDSIRRIWRCGLREGSLSLALGFEVSHLPVSVLASGWMYLSTTSPEPHLPHLPNTPCHNDKGLNLWN